MRRFLIAILALLAMPAMFHLAKMEVSHAHAEMTRSHEAGAAAMPECPFGFVCPVKAERLSVSGAADFAAGAATPQLLALLAAIPLLPAFARPSLYRPPTAVPIPSDPKVALSTFKRE